MALEYDKRLNFQKTAIEGLLVLDLPVYGDNRGWFKENFQRQKMTLAGTGEIPDLKVVQNNISFNARRGATRGIHAEPWDKYISIGSGTVFGAWVDLRGESDTYGQVFTTILNPSKAIFVPRGVANSFQALEDNTVYTYLVNDHWSPEAGAKYTFVNLADPELDIEWPISLDSSEVEISDKDRVHPLLKDVIPMPPKKTLVIGALGQLGREVTSRYLQRPPLKYPERISGDLPIILTDITSDPNLNVQSFDFTKSEEYDKFNWSEIGTIINCAGYTNVDEAETESGRKGAWNINASAPAKLANIANEHDITLVHISSDYVFDGKLCDHPAGVPHVEYCRHTESEIFSPLGVYGQSKAAGDIAVATAKKHYILRTSWVIGDGKNFVKTMAMLANKDINPEVVDDQYGRLTFTSTLYDAIDHILSKRPEYGTYNVSNEGKSATWFEIAQSVFELLNKDSSLVTPIGTDEYNLKYSRNAKPISPRPTNSIFNLSKIKNIGFTPTDWHDELVKYLDRI